MRQVMKEWFDKKNNKFKKGILMDTSVEILLSCAPELQKLDR